MKSKADGSRYPLIIYDKKKKKIIEWETEDNRYFSRGGESNGHFYIKTDTNGQPLAEFEIVTDQQE